MLRKVKLWFYRNFCTITRKEAEKLGLLFKFNIHGDEINYLNCRSVWADNKGWLYRIKEYINEEE